MGERKRMGKPAKNRLMLCMGCFLLSSISVWLLLLEDALQPWVVGAVFWTGAAAGIALYMVLYRKWRTVIEKALSPGKLPWGWHFFSCRAAVVTDLLWILTGAGTIVTVLRVVKVSEGLEIILLFVLLLTTYLHFIFNGRIYLYFEKKAGGRRNEG